MDSGEGTGTLRAGAPLVEKARRGQVLVIFAGTLVILLLMAALVVDLAWLWTNSLRIQRAADAGALAGVTYLPAFPATAASEAKKVTRQNGYDDQAVDITVTPTPDPTNPRRLDVTVTAPVETFFLRLIGMDTITISRKAKAEYILPVPMGSPLNYYGIYGLLRSEDGGTTIATDGDSTLKVPTVNKGSTTWQTVGNVYVTDNQSSWVQNEGVRQAWGGNWNFGFPSGADLRGIGVELVAKTNDAGCRIRVRLSWNNGSSWTSGTSGSDPGIKETANLTTSYALYNVGGTSSDWNRSWDEADGDFSNAEFQVQLENYDPGSGCNDNQRVDVDRIRVIVYWTSYTFIPDANVAGPSGEVLTPQGFWGEMLTQGAESASGDAYLPYYVERTSKVNPQQKVDGTGQSGGLYDYAIEMAANSSGGQVHIFDPGFCDQNSFVIGTGDQYYSGSGAVSSFYSVWDTQGTLYDQSDDRLIGSSGNTFRRQSGSCDAYHNGWYQVPLTAAPEATLGLRAGASGPHIYRLRATTYDPTDISAQRNVQANNSFGLLAKGTSGGTPRVYGIGAMEMFTPLPGGQTSSFYLAQIAAVHADKTMEIKLWDPGDTNQNAYIQIMKPTSSGWTAVTNMSYTAKRGQLNPATGTYVIHSNANNCDSNTGTNVDRVQVYQSSSRFNGCWLTILVGIPSDYTAPQDGWWKIEYHMQGSSGTEATDITTWQVDIRGNPVHLVEP
jgi:hypothetical protein